MSSGTTARATSLRPPSTFSNERGGLGAARGGRAASSAGILVAKGVADERHGGDAIYGADEVESGGDQADELEAQVGEEAAVVLPLLTPDTPTRSEF